MNSRTTKCFFFDRDGVVNRQLVDEYILAIEQFDIVPEFLRVFVDIKKRGAKAILISNQQGVGKSLMTYSDLQCLHKWMQSVLLEATGFAFDDIVVSTVLENSNCFTRKPNPGMLLQAIEKWHLTAKDCAFIGDAETDMTAGRAAGLHSVHRVMEPLDMARLQLLE